MFVTVNCKQIAVNRGLLLMCLDTFALGFMDEITMTKQVLLQSQIIKSDAKERNKNNFPNKYETTKFFIVHQQLKHKNCKQTADLPKFRPRVLQVTTANYGHL